MIKAIFLAGAASLALASAVRAEEVLSYQSLPYTVITQEGDTFPFAPYSLGESITGTVTLAMPLQPNMVVERVTPVSYSFTDGVISVSSSDTNPYNEIDFSTDASGKITEWFALIAQSFTTPSGDTFSEDFRLAYLLDGLSFNLYDTSGQNICDTSVMPCNVLGDTIANSSGSGVWTVESLTAAPEPASWTMMLVGIGSVGAGLRLRRRAIAEPA